MAMEQQNQVRSPVSHAFDTAYNVHGRRHGPNGTSWPQRRHSARHDALHPGASKSPSRSPQGVVPSTARCRGLDGGLGAMGMARKALCGAMVSPTRNLPNAAAPICRSGSPQGTACAILCGGLAGGMGAGAAVVAQGSCTPVEQPLTRVRCFPSSEAPS